jgi:cytochrome c oxidase cbb3-type subunit III
MNLPSNAGHGFLRQRAKFGRAALKAAGVLVLIISICAVAAVLYSRHARMEYRLLAVLPNDAAADPALVRFAAEEAAPVYAKHCATCHGADMRGRVDLGAPNLVDAVSLYGRGDVFDIERSVLYGIRAGDSKGRDVSSMPAFGLTGVLSSGQIQSVVEYVMQLSGRPYQAAAANDGSELYSGAGGCFDCHAPDGRGNSDYGAPDLTANVWNSGGDRQSLFNALYNGQRHVMPAWRNTLSLVEIRALAVYLYASSHPPQPEMKVAGEP